jgi:SH3-like domain-containing protein
VSLKTDKVFARKGPGGDYPALWVYRARGLPVQIVAEGLDWLRVCDPEGGAAWVSRTLVEGRRTVEALGPAPLPLRRKPDPRAPVEGLVNPHALASLERCQGTWCKVSVSGVAGWAPSDGVWGVAPAAQCR